MNLSTARFGAKSSSTPAHHSVMSALHWPARPANVELIDGEVQVICVSLDVPEARFEGLKGTLCPDELERAGRFHFQDGRHNFVAARGLLREILGCYLDLPAEQVEFFYNASGKPELGGHGAETGLHFNVAHSGSDAVFAMTRLAAVGVDLERVRAIPDMLEMVSFALSTREKRDWEGLEPAEWRRAFFDCWARKEAFLKGVGEGLQRSPNEIEVPLCQSSKDEALRVFDCGDEVPDWTLRSLSAGDYAVAVAVKGQPTRLSCWAWQPREEMIAAS